MLGHRGVAAGYLLSGNLFDADQGDSRSRRLVRRAKVSKSTPEIMVPQVATVEELMRIHGKVQRIHKEVQLTHGISVKFKFAPCWRWCAAACAPAAWRRTRSSSPSATNDLTQATFSFSREDAGKQVSAGLPRDRHPAGQPVCRCWDIKGVGQLMKMAVRDAAARPGRT